MNQIIIFIQAPADVIHFLKIYENEKSNSSFFVFCINVKFSYDYIKSLNLNLNEINFIPYNFNLSFRNILLLFKIRIRLKSIFHTYFKKFTKTKVIFFSPWYDWITFYLINKLNKNNNKIHYYKHYLDISTEPKKSLSFREKIILYKYKIMTGIDLCFADDNIYERILYPLKKNEIKTIHSIKSSSKIKRYFYDPQINFKKSLLLIETNIDDITYYYVKKLKFIIKKYKEQGYSIVIKGHPRNGFSKSIKSLIDHEIPKLIPAELIEVKSFKYIIGIHSFSLCYFSKNHRDVYSIINSFDFKNKKQKDETIEYLKVNSKNKIKFLNPIQ